jgi:hypothetical protein
MSQEEVLRMVASARDQATGPLRKVENALHALGKKGAEQTRLMRDNWQRVHGELDKVSQVAKTAAAPALEAIGISSLSAVGAVAALTAGLKNFVDQGVDIAAFGRKVQLTTDTIRGLEGVAEKFQVDTGAVRQGEQGFADAMYLIRRRRGEVYAHLLAQRRDFAVELAATPETVAGNERALQKFLKLLEEVKRVHGLPTARAFSKDATGTDAFVDLLRDGNAGLQQAIALTLKLRGGMDVGAAQKWTSNWVDFKATIEGVRNTIGKDLLPDLTALAKEAENFFAEHRIEIAKGIVKALREMGSAALELKKDLPQIRGFFQDVATTLHDIAAVWRFLKMTPGQAWTELNYGLKVPDSDIRLRADQSAAAPPPTIPWSEWWQNEKRSWFGLRPDALNHANPPPGAANAGAILQGLRDRGLDAAHTAILGGNIEQESNFDPTKPNIAEGALGLIQWRLDRREALDALAAKRHTLETDAAVQLDFLMQELQSSPAGQAFLAARTPEQMNSALRGFIRYGDNSEDQRLAYGRSLLPLAEKTKPGSLLAAAGANGLGGAGGKISGAASISVDVNAPPGTRVKADTSGDLFDTIEINRGLAMQQAD